MTSHLKGPSDGNWSVFAEKVVKERDEALERASKAEAELDRVSRLINATLGSEREEVRMLRGMLKTTEPSPEEKKLIADAAAATEAFTDDELEAAQAKAELRAVLENLDLASLNKALDEARAERDEAVRALREMVPVAEYGIQAMKLRLLDFRAQVEKVRKHEAREASFRARQSIAQYVAQELASSHDEHEAAEIRALIERWEP